MNQITFNHAPLSAAELADHATQAERDSALDEFFAEQRRIRTERKSVVACAIPALTRLIGTFAQRTGQSYHLRALLYSLWNGKPTSLVEVLNLDWDLRKDFGVVLLAFGHDDKVSPFFYDTMQAAITSAGQWAWFLEAGE